MLTNIPVRMPLQEAGVRFALHVPVGRIIPSAVCFAEAFKPLGTHPARRAHETAGSNDRDFGRLHNELSLWIAEPS